MAALMSINAVKPGNACAAKHNSRSSRPPGSSDPFHGEANLKSLARPVRALPVRLLTVGKNRTAGVQMVVQEYMEKLQRYCSIEDVRLRSNPKKTSDVRAQIEGEDIKLLQHIMPKDQVVLLDKNGNDVNSEQLANLIGHIGTMQRPLVPYLQGASAIVFCIGGPYGHGQHIRMRADVTIRLSSMVLNHQVALIVLLEQLYRAWTILKGQKYHHQ